MIDCQFHWHPPALCEHDVGRAAPPRATPISGGYRYEVTPVETQNFTGRFIDLDAQMQAARDAGIEAVVSGPSAVGDVGARPDVGEAVEVATLLNEEAAQAQSQYPGRFHGLAVLPMQDTQAALDVLDHAIQRLELCGVCVYSNVGGEPIATDELRSVWARIEQLDKPVFLHPTDCFRHERVAAFATERPLGYLFDSSFAAMSLIVSGTLDSVPGLRVVLPHLGGTLPYLVGRMETYRRGGLWPGITEPIAAYLRRFYFDSVSATPGALRLAREIVDDDHLLFATDYPYWSLEDGVRFVLDNVEPELLEAVCHGNAERLLGWPAEETPAAIDQVARTLP
jgi:aminocarboxymuconate-semialdehyde decarboxylase